MIKYATAQGGMEKKERSERQGGEGFLNEASMKAINKADTVIQRDLFVPPFVCVKDSRKTLPCSQSNPSTVLFQANNGEREERSHLPPPPRDPFEERKTMTYQIAALMLLNLARDSIAVGVHWVRIGVLWWCVIRGDGSRSIVFHGVGYDTAAVARGDLLFLFLFFSFVFLGIGRSKKDCSQKDCATLRNRHEWWS